MQEKCDIAELEYDQISLPAGLWQRLQHPSAELDVFEGSISGIRQHSLPMWVTLRDPKITGLPQDRGCNHGCSQQHR